MTFLAAARALLDELERGQEDALERAAALCAEAIGSGGLAHAFGTGHSRIAVEELFPRYGSYPGFHPLVELSMTFHTQVAGANGQRQAMFIERVEGLAEAILANFRLAPPDVMIVFSAGGTTAVPIEMAIGARERGLPVIAVTAVAGVAGLRVRPLERHAPARPRRRRTGPAHPAGRRARPARRPGHAGGPRLDDHGGGAGERAQGAHRRPAQRGRPLPPVITSPSLVGAERSRALFDAAYAEHARRLGRALRTTDTEE